MNNLQLDLLAPRWKDTANTMVACRPYHDPFREFHAARLAAAGEEQLSFDDKEWNHNANDAVGLDVESYRNFFVVCFMRFSDGKRLAFELSERCRLNTAGVLYVLKKNLIVTFNGDAYDLPMIYFALTGSDCEELKRASDRLIGVSAGGRSGYNGSRELEKRFRFKLNHIDLMEPNPAVRQGLKIIHGRLHGRFMVDLPFEPDAWLTRQQMNLTTLYCHNDLDSTKSLFEAMREPLALREALGAEYGMNLRSKSDAQIGEALVRKRVEAALRKRIERNLAPAPKFRYEIPDFISFQDWRMNDLLEQLRDTEFQVTAAGKVIDPPALEKLKVRIGTGTYTMGIGGLHSTEAHRALRANEHYGIRDVDVASQYPTAILKLGLYPEAVGPHFLQIYGKIVAERLENKEKAKALSKVTEWTDELRAERERLRVRTDGGRIQANGVYGKLGSMYSILYAPHLMIATTVTCQLAVLMLIERAEANGHRVISANTDGVVFYYERARAADLDGILARWEEATGFSLEHTEYAELYNSSVNTYIAIKEDGKVKRKGYIADPWKEGDLRGMMMKNPQMTICSEAVLRWITERKPIEDTVRECRDPRAFVTVIKVSSGATWRGHWLGRAVRYYWAIDSDPILRSDTEAQVPKTEGAHPLPELTDELPPDVDYLRYCHEAARLAADLGIDFTA